MIDTHSLVWREIASYCAAQIEVLRDDLEVHNLREEKTEYIRGQICALRSLLLVPHSSQKQEADQEQPKYPDFY